MTEQLLSIRDLHLAMTSFDGAAHVLNGINLDVGRREIWGLVGESGCGKSLTGLSISQLLKQPPAHYLKGEIVFEGRDVLKLRPSEMEPLRGKKIGMIFQDPTTNLNPSYKIGVQLTDVALAAASRDASILDCPAGSGRRARQKAARALAARMLDAVGIPDAEARLEAYPHEFSGGMRQRVLIAMALIGRPDLLIADEPTTALDVSVQAQILRLMKDIVDRFDIGVILITHNLGVVAETCTHVAVMYAGNIVECGLVDDVIGRPAHPYTRALMSAIPNKTSVRGSLNGLGGAVPNLIAPPPGCRFAPRCVLATPDCRAELPAMIPVGAAHSAACIHLDKGLENG
ncbi:ABC transporter ATP-binding protein [Paracoccus sp. (in: a-proteobacteria)]|uniref:ABC transporter ATP-binding protein n=1 Tax=Paracoccus sp. TaxID=267 RepID=UPI003A8A7D06